ncbi:MAG TPA: alpha/beta fold hydrolase [Steroidobacteraceae bacterium]|nr:alpha/beta fold hydrolase [Steroidobacteraceae bacterium]
MTSRTTRPGRRALGALAAACLLSLAASAQTPPPAPNPAISPTHRERGTLVYEGIPPTDPALAARLERYLDSRGATFLDWTADGSLLIKTRFGETEQLHRVAGPGAAREQLTFSSDPVEWGRAARVGGGALFWRDRAGDDNYQIFYLAPDGQTRALTSGDFIHGSPVWAHDGKRVAFYGNERDGLSYDIYLADVSVNTPPQLLIGGREDAWYPLDWSADDSRLLVWKYVSGSESYLYLADVATGALTPLEAKPAAGGIRRAKFGPDGRSVYVLTDEDSEFAAVRLKDPVTHENRRVTPELNWDVEDFDVSPDGRYLAYLVDEDGRSRLNVLDLQAKQDLAPAGLPEGHLGNVRFDREGKRLAFSVESPTAPRDAYVFDLEHGKLERWTHSEIGPLDPKSLVAPELVKFPTWDRVNGHPRLLSAWLYRPAHPSGPTPVIISLHGGPEAQARPEWDPFVQFLVNELGYTVLAPNVRGSAGYGKTFLSLDNGMLREDALRDVGSLLVWIGVQPGLDREHVVVMGGSYGGYLTLAALISYGERLKGGVDVAGISDFVSFLRNTSPYRRDLRRSEYGDERDLHMRVFLERISPLNSAARIKKPLLVVAGVNDPRVPLSESEQLVWRVRNAGGEVWYLTAKEEGHDFRRKSDRDAYLEVAADFLERMRH